jgi:hypothetical protein
MLRGFFIFFFFTTGAILSQPFTAGRYKSLPPGQLVIHDKSGKTEETNNSINRMHQRFTFPDHFPVIVPSQNIYNLKHVNQIDVFDSDGQLAFVFEFSWRGGLQNGKIITDHLIRWRNYRIGENEFISVIAHYDNLGRITKRDSAITTLRKLEPADTVVSYTTFKHWVHLSGSVVNDRNNFYNEKYYEKKVRDGRVYLKKKFPVNFQKDSLYLDRFIQEDKNFSAIAYTDTEKREIYGHLTPSHYLKKRYHPITKTSFGTAGAEFEEPELDADFEKELKALHQLIPKGRMNPSPSYYKCTVTRKGLIDSIFIEKQDPSRSDTHTISPLYTVRYRYNYMAYFSGDEYEMEPQIILREQDNEYGKNYFQANFNKRFDVPSNQLAWLGDITAFVKNRVKAIHLYYQGKDKVQSFEFDTTGKMIGGMDPHGLRRWKDFTDKTDRRFIINEYYDSNTGLQKKDSTVHIPKIVKHKDTTFSYQRMERYSYKTGNHINERNIKYNEKYLKKRVESDISEYDDSKVKGRIYLKEPLKTNYEGNRLYLCRREINEHSFKATKDTFDITANILDNHRFKRKLKQETFHEPVSGEDFIPPYEFSGPTCGGSGYSYNKNEGTHNQNIFHSISWTFNSKGLYDTCYKSDPVIHDTSGKNGEKWSENSAEKKVAQKYVLYTIRYEYY